MNIKFTIRCALLFLNLVDATNRHLRGRELQWSSVAFAATAQDNRTTSCPTNRVLPCTASDQLVVCGSGCTYNGFCEGIGAGFFDCEKVVDDAPASIAIGEPNPNAPSCPEISNLIPCPLFLDPVRCGPNDCQYGSPCDADAAGFDPETECKSVFDIPKPEPGFCPVTGPAISCIDIPDPVVCGLDECEYTNLCLALGAGFEDDDCTFQNPLTLNEEETKDEDECPIGNRGFVPCPKEVNPVLCGDVCFYDNLCSAQTTGLFTEENCVSVADELDELTWCPETDPDQMCILIFAPVACGEEACQYSNLCLAESAGYTDTNCEPLEDTAKPVEENQCPETSPAVTCSTKKEPVLCKNSCEYGNLCLGTGAGFLQADCTPIVEPLDEELQTDPERCPQPIGEFLCTEIFAPVYCGDVCQYDNDCFATAAGYDKDNECEPAPEEYVEIDDPLLFVDSSDDGVVEIDNPLIFADPDDTPDIARPSPNQEASGDTDTVTTSCPPPSPSVTCFAVVEPVTCGSAFCEYGNLCTAIGAGFDPDECEQTR